MSVLESGVAAMLGAMEQLGASVGAGMQGRLHRLRQGVRREVRRAAMALAAAIAVTAFGLAALVFGAVAILIGAWNSHPVLAAALISLGFALLMIIALLLVRGNTR